MEQDEFRPVLDADGPFVSVFLEDSHDTEDAGRQLDLKLRDIAARLREQGADEATVDAVVTAVRDGERAVGRGGRGVVAAGGRVLLDRRLAGAPAVEVARVSARPYLLPFASHGHAGVGYLLVLVDNRGADLVSYDRDGREVATETVTGEDSPLHKVRGGGLAHTSMQASVEETRNQNIEDVADRIAVLGPELVLLAGEQQSRRALHTKLAPALQEITRELSSGGRAAGASRDDLRQEVETVLAEHRLQELDGLAERYRMGLGRGDGLAVTGLADVVAALAAANVDTLLIGDPADTVVWVGENTGEIATDRESLRAFGVEGGHEQRVDEALPWAALASGASVTVMDERVELKDGVGALLRHN
ncbi:Rv2629 family ribosome hibernation factor [Amycolatopsis rifamycinica]|uniref:Peptide chain release factor 2 n=1 Tax=Amycolatopsis rifamycinica TaxID=287986 RepID=A0A066U453_9PSEU|nr:hypothetical protein [Amycolatopsis rifamycinica]KDN21880.1 hypothetical protein DV20_13235 [Amycolatopsis rifamycinica]